MSWRSDKRKNKTIEDKRKQVESEESSAMMEESLRKAQEEVAQLRQKIEELKGVQKGSEEKQGNTIKQPPRQWNLRVIWR